MTGPTPTIPPNRAPGRLVARTFDVANELVDEDVLDVEGVAYAAERHALDTNAGRIQTIYIYDGDTGECWMTIVAPR